MNNTQVTVFQVSAFTKNGRGGNLAGVVLNAASLSNQQKLSIAQSVGYSETAFVSPDDNADFEVSFFTTTEEVDFCGHATLAAFSVLSQQGIIGAGDYVQRTKAGLLAVAINDLGQITMDQALPKKLGTVGYQEVAAVLGIDEALISETNLPLEMMSTGLPDLIVPIRTGYLDTIQPNDAMLAEFSNQHNLVGVHVFELSSGDEGYSASCRNFAPAFGIPEESATGSASGVLACYLAEHVSGRLGKMDEPGRQVHYVFEQGRAMKCSSEIQAEVECQGGEISKVRVGGHAKLIGTKVYEVPQT